MHRKKFFYFLIPFLIFIITIGFFLIKQHNVSNKTSASQSSSINSTAENADDTDNNTASSDTIVEDNNYLDISDQDCADKCKSYSEADDVKYCKEVCNLADAIISNTVNNNCDSINDDDLEKYYCFKNLAFIKKDSSICDEILDDNLQKACKNKIEK